MIFISYIRTSTRDSFETADLEIEDKEDGSYIVEYTPHTGLYEVKIEVNGQPLDGSTWSVQVIPHQYQLKFSFGSNGSGPGQFNGPYDIAVDKKTGTIAVSDHENKRIQLFDSDGRYLREIGLRASCSSLDFTKSGHIIAVTVWEDDWWEKLRLSFSLNQ